MVGGGPLGIRNHDFGYPGDCRHAVWKSFALEHKRIGAMDAFNDRFEVVKVNQLSRWRFIAWRIRLVWFVEIRSRKRCDPIG